MNIESKEDATRIAQQVIERGAQIDTSVKELQTRDMQGLECSENVQLERLSAENAVAARVLAQWILREPPPRLKPRIGLVIERPDSPPYNIEVKGLRVTPPMLDAAEDLLHTLMSGERPPLKGLYELCAAAFGTTRADAKKRLLGAAYGKHGENAHVSPTVAQRARLDALITDLAAAAKRYARAVSATNRSQHLATAAVMFVTCAAIEVGENPATMRDLEQRLLAVIIAAPTRQRRS